MSGAGFRLRPGRPEDADAFLGLWDEAVAWMVARGQSEQWGIEPVSSRPQNRAFVREWTNRPGLTVAESDDGAVIGVCVVGDEHPDYAPPIDQPEVFLLLLLVSRSRAGQGMGAKLIDHAAGEARDAGAEVLRVDCWAGAPTLVDYYERQGFTRSDTYSRGDWHGVIFEMALATASA